MTNEEQLPTVWTPSKFDGVDLLPIASVGVMDTTGQENIDADDLVLPSLRLLQGMSDEVTEQSVEGAAPGVFYHTGAKEIMKGPVRVLFCAHTKSRALFPKEGDARFAGISKCVSRDGIAGDEYGDCGSCDHTEWGEDRNPPLCSESHNFTALTCYGPCVIRFSRTSFKTAKEFLSTWRFSGKRIHTHPVLISVKQHQRELPGGKKATYYSLELKWDQKEAVPPAAQDAANTIYKAVTSAHEQGNFTNDEEKVVNAVDTNDIPF